MSFVRPTLAQLIARTVADLTSRLSLTTPVLRRSVVGVLARVWSGCVNSAHGYVAWCYRQLWAGTADADQLDRHGADYRLPRTAATYAQGQVQFTGAPDAAIAAGTVLQRSDGTQYVTLADATLDADGQALVDVRASDAGAAANTDAAIMLTLVSPIVAVYATATVQTPGITDGTDTESDAAYRARIVTRKRLRPQGGAVDDYVLWSQQVAGITRTWVYPQWMGEGRVGVFIVADGQEDIIPDADLLAAVQTYIDDTSRRPVAAKVTVYAPTAVPIALNISDLSPDTTDMQAAIISALDAYLRRVGQPDMTVARVTLISQIAAVPGVGSFSLTAPLTDTTISQSQIPVLGTVTWV